MTDFLTFLNTADLDTLTQIPGITRKTAGNIIAARPFDFVEDCAKVPGMSKNLLGRAQTYFEQELNDSPNNSLATVEPQSQPIVIGSGQPEEENDVDEPSFWARLGGALATFLRALIRLILLVALIAAVGALLYYGLPYINRTFIAPVEQNTAQINRLEADIAALQTQLDETNSRLNSLETSAEAHTVSIEKLTEIQTSIEAQLNENNDKALLALKHEVMTTRALDMLGRARVYLAQSNFGLAREDVQDARDLLAELQSETGDEVLLQAINRLGLALGNLPAFPVVAAGDLEIAWQVLMSGTASNEVTPSPFPEEFLTITPTAAGESSTPTPAPPPTFEPTPTP
jgi:hypothetical protein